MEEELSGFVITEKKKRHEDEEEKHTNTHEDKNAYQVFDQMSTRGKTVTKKRWKEIAKRYYKPYGRSERCRKDERVMLKNMAKWLNGHMLEYTVENGNKKTSLKMKMHNRPLLDRRLMLSFTKKIRRAKLEHKGERIKHKLIYAKLARGYKTATKKHDKWMKRKQKQGQQKKKIIGRFFDYQLSFH